MIDALTQKQRQLLALAILALVVVMIFTLTVAPLWALNRHYLDTIDGLDNRLQILQRTASAGSGLRSQHEQLKRSLASNRHYLKSDQRSAGRRQPARYRQANRGIDRHGGAQHPDPACKRARGF